MAATKAMIGPVLMTMSRIGDFACELLAVPLDRGNSSLFQGFEKGISIHGDELCGLSGGNPPKLEQLGRHCETHGLFKLPAREARAVRKTFRVVEGEGVHHWDMLVESIMEIKWGGGCAADVGSWVVEGRMRREAEFHAEAATR